MSQLDRLKREIDFHEKLFLGTLAVLVGLIGWAGSHYIEISAQMFVLVTIVTLMMFWLSIYQYFLIKQLLRSLGERDNPR